MRRLLLVVFLLGPTSLFATDLSFGPPRHATAAEATLVPRYVQNQPVFVVPIFVSGADDIGTEPGKRLQSIALHLQFAPVQLIWGSAFQKAGLTKNLSSVFEHRFAGIDNAGWVIVFDEKRAPLNAGRGQALIGELIMTSPPDIGDQQITVSFRPESTALATQAGTIAATKDHGLRLNTATFSVPR